MSSIARCDDPALLLKQARDLRVAAELRRIIENELMDRDFDPDFEVQSYIMDQVAQLESRVRRERAPAQAPTPSRRVAP